MKGTLATSAKPSALHKHARHPADAPSPADVTVLSCHMTPLPPSALSRRVQSRGMRSLPGCDRRTLAALLFAGRRARTTAQ